ncbi:MAG: hypothetical protein IKK97_04090, partial [Phascolarctobacterium sp.]|nr:hypothetical protein [Phascolarctobacterium sp.]
MLICAIQIILALVVLGVAVVAAYICLQGDAKMFFDMKKRTAAVKVSETDQRLDFEVELDYKNVGKQEATLIDAYMRIYLPQEQYDDVLLRGKVNLKGVLRDDDYFEAVLAPAGTGKTMVLLFEAYAKNGKTIAEALANVPDVDVALLVECRG